jgi:hypothetical protein
MATRSDIRSRARIHADQDSSDFPTDAQYNEYINECVKDVWFDLIQAGWPINFDSTTLTVSGATPVALGVSGTVGFVRGVFWRNGSSYVELDRLNEGDRASLMSSAGAISGRYYDVRIDPTSGPVLEVLPSAAGSYVVHYIKEHPGFTADGDTWYGPARSDELIVLKVAAKAVRKEGRLQDWEALKQDYRDCWVKVTGMASWFNMRHSAKIRDVMGAQRRDAFDFDVEV